MIFWIVRVARRVRKRVEGAFKKKGDAKKLSEATPIVVD
jgi:hypothetical protein